MRRTAWGVVASVVLVGVLFVAVFPTRTYIAQRRSIEAAERRVVVLSAENDKLASRVQRLDTDAEIERLAREQYNLVRPGEEAYAILPARREPSHEKPRPAQDESEGLLSRVWDGLTFWS